MPLAAEGAAAPLPGQRTEAIKQKRGQGMNGAETLVQTLVAGGLTTCFANPGTSEMHFVAALDRAPDLRCILCLFEGGATGAADGYFRMSGQVAATLLHLAPGFGNGFANLHNARKAGSGVLTVLGEHATWHLDHESPLRGDTAGIARTVSHWVRTATSSMALAHDGAAALSAARARGGQIATLILPADTAWGDGSPDPVACPPAPPLPAPKPAAIAAAARALGQPGAALLLGGAGLWGDGARLAGRIAAATGARLIAPYFVTRMARGAGAVLIENIPYNPDMAAEFLSGVSTIITCGTSRPTNFFGYLGSASTPEPPGCILIDLCPATMDVLATLAQLATAAGAQTDGPTLAPALPPLPDPAAALTADIAGAVLAHHLPAQAIVVEEAITSAAALAAATRAAAPHDWLNLMGGAIGNGLPLALGAAIACPDRRVVALVGDGCAMYTLQALWTMARERLPVITLIFANRGYQVLRLELANVGVASVGRNAARMFDVEDPCLDWVALAVGHGVTGIRATTAGELAQALTHAFAATGPTLIEVQMP